VIPRKVSSEPLTNDAKLPINTLSIRGERQILLQDNVFRLHEHDDGNLFMEFGYILKILDPVKHVEVRT
jgi:hypothetical protein